MTKMLDQNGNLDIDYTIGNLAYTLHRLQQQRAALDQQIAAQIAALDFAVQMSNELKAPASEPAETGEQDNGIS